MTMMMFIVSFSRCSAPVSEPVLSVVMEGENPVWHRSEISPSTAKRPVSRKSVCAGVFSKQGPSLPIPSTRAAVSRVTARQQERHAGDGPWHQHAAGHLPACRTLHVAPCSHAAVAPCFTSARHFSSGRIPQWAALTRATHPYFAVGHDASATRFVKNDL